MGGVQEEEEDWGASQMLTEGTWEHWLTPGTLSDRWLPPALLPAGSYRQAVGPVPEPLMLPPG